MGHADEDDALGGRKEVELRRIACFCVVCTAVMNDENSL